MTDLAQGAHDIEIEVPLRTERAGTVRVVAASLAADAGFTIDEIDDLRLAISEVFSMLVEASPGGRARVVFDVSGDQVAATIGHVNSAAAIDIDELGATILTAVVDDYSVEGNSIRVVKTGRESNSTA